MARRRIGRASSSSSGLDPRDFTNALRDTVRELDRMRSAAEKSGFALQRVSSGAGGGGALGALGGLAGGALGLAAAGAAGFVANNVAQVGAAVDGGKNLASNLALPLLDRAAQTFLGTDVLGRGRELLGNVTAESNAFDRSVGLAESLARSGLDVDAGLAGMLRDVTVDQERAAQRGRRAVEDAFGEDVVQTAHDGWRTFRKMMDVGAVSPRTG